MASCVICKKGPMQGVAVFRINAKGQPGLWACRKHLKQTDAPPVDPEVEQIVRRRRRPMADRADIVDRLRAQPWGGSIVGEAADEIERLRVLCAAYEDGTRMAAELRDQNPCTECSGTGNRAAQSMAVAGREAEITRLRAIIAGIESGDLRVVPAYPTAEQIAACRGALSAYIRSLSQMDRDLNRRRHGGLKVPPDVKAAIRYKAMLAAAPRVKP